MEVHHHAHHGHERKTWKNYFWEFFMLFLAVFCGFLAEIQVEHYIENQREKKYMQTMLEDLKSDTTLLYQLKKRWASVNNSIDSVVYAINIENRKVDYNKLYRNVHEALNYWGFTYNDRTISQLKNSGSFRLIKNEKVALKLISYDQFNNDAVKNISDQHNQLYLNACLIRSRFLNESLISEIEEEYPNQPASIKVNERVNKSLTNQNSIIDIESYNKLLFEFRNNLIALKRDYQKNMIYAYNGNIQRTNELIELIKLNYNLD